MQEIKVEEFVRRIKKTMDENADCRLSFFLGAGCSVSSGIPSASRLVDRWLGKLKHHKTGNDENLDEWAKLEFKDYDKENKSIIYGEVIEKLFATSEERQREIERLIDGKDPGFGYAVLAQLVTHENEGNKCNVLLTTNFDDLVADALYLFTRKKPLVITHEALSGFVRITRGRPLVVKLHGDAHLQPKNTGNETKQLPEQHRKVIKNLLSEMGLIFIGYGGNDESIAKVLEELPSDCMPWGVYWVNEKLPSGVMGRWLSENCTFHVKHNDFDELMLLIWSEFELKHPDENWYKELIDKYRVNFQDLKAKVDKKPVSEEKIALEKAVEKATKEFPDWYSAVEEATKYEDNDLEKAQKIYEETYSKFNKLPYFLNAYAGFLFRKKIDNIKCEELCLEALKIDPNHSEMLGNYALFLFDVKKDDNLAEEYFNKALKCVDVSAIVMCNYAIFLKDIKKNFEKAEQNFRMAIKLKPLDSDVTLKYIFFLIYDKKDYSNADILYHELAFNNPDKVKINFGYAIFLNQYTKDYYKANNYYKLALKIDPDDLKNISLYAHFLYDKLDDIENAQYYYKHILEREPNNTKFLSSYAMFFQKIKDLKNAESYYLKAINSDLNNAVTLTMYAGFLCFQKLEIEKGEKYFKKALKIDSKNPTVLGGYAHFLNDIKKDNVTSEKYFIEALIADPKDSNNNCNFAGFLFSLGKTEKAKKYLEIALENSIVSVIELECYFYIYAHYEDKKETDIALIKIKNYLIDGVFSFDFNLDQNVKYALSQKHPEPEFLKDLSKVITGKKDLKILSKYEIWSEYE